MILSMNVFGFADGKPNIASFEAMKAAGFTDVTIEFEGGKDSPITSDDFESRVRELKKTLNSLDLTVSHTHLSCYSFAQGASIRSEEKDKIIERTIIATAILDCPWGTIHPITSYDAINDRKYNLEVNIEFVKPLIKLGEKCGVGIAVENIPTWRDAEKNKYFSAHHRELIELVDYFEGNPYIGICWDTGHANLNMHCADQYEAIREIDHRLKTMHIASNDGRYDDHLMPPAFGTVDCERLAAVLKEIKYDGVLSCELHGSELFEAQDTYNRLSYACGEYLLNLMK